MTPTPSSGFTPPSERRSGPNAPDFSVLLKAELSGSERLLWSGQPIPSRSFQTTLPIFLFAIPWTAFALFWESMALGPLLGTLDMGKAPDGITQAFSIVFPLFGLPFIAIGFWMMSRPWAAARAARKTIYALTNQRALILDNSATRSVQSFSLASIKNEIKKTEKADGTGSLYFSFRHSVNSDGDRILRKKGFEHIHDVAAVYDKVKRAVNLLQESSLSTEASP